MDPRKSKRCLRQGTRSLLLRQRRLIPAGTDPAVENGPLAAGVTAREREPPASEGDPRVRRQAEPRDAAYVAAENFLTAEDRDATVPGRLSLPLRQASATLAAARVTAKRTSPAREIDPIAAEVEGAAPASKGDLGVKG